MLVTRLMEEATKSYEKILFICKGIEENLLIMGLDLSFKFEIEERYIIFEFERKGVYVFVLSFPYQDYKSKDESEIIEELMTGLMKSMLHWKNIINALQ